ncbi:hypothetical protein [Streptomyces sp. NPDC047097]|uniref:hypothetical protein n=1 Tax=Streptomyces sp. NPDC047097 TaxID=3155260 RepID=UPI00340B7458
MYYDLRLLDIHAVLAIPGITRTPLLGKTTRGGTAALEAMPADGRARYEGLLGHYATMSAEAESASVFATAEKTAHRLYRIVDRPRPRFRHSLGLDAGLAGHVVTRLPWALRAALNTRMYRLDMARP